jgi:hypothetical protein
MSRPPTRQATTDYMLGYGSFGPGSVFTGPPSDSVPPAPRGAQHIWKGPSFAAVVQIRPLTAKTWVRVP